MTRLFPILFAALMIFTALSLQSSETHQSISADHTYLALSGRYLRSDTHQILFAYPGVSITIDTDAPDVSAELTDIPRLADDGSLQNNTFAIVIDGQFTQKLILKSGKSVYAIAKNLSGGRHRIQLVKLTEGLVGQAIFHRYILPIEAHVFQCQPARRTIEFIGNSITCGYGIESNDPSHSFSYLTENAYSAYAMQAARALGADASLVSYSGKGIYRNWADTVNYRETMLELYERTMPLHPEFLWDHAQAIPHAVVISLGTNDFSPPLGAQAALFVPRYIQLLQTVRQKYGDNVPVFCLNSPMLEGSNRANLEKWIGESMASMRDTHIYYYPLRICQPEEGRGADYHPSLKTAGYNAHELATFIKSTLNW